MKKLLSIALVVVLLAGMAVSGTMAYLQDTDSDVNVMTLGNVSIEQNEYQRATNADGSYKTDSTGYVLEPFTQGKPLYPAVIPTNGTGWGWDEKQVMFEQVGANGGGMTVFTEPNAVDKFVFVENTGKSDAYVRTLIAYEAGSKTIDEWKAVVSTSYHFAWGDPVDVGVVTVDDNNYVVLEYVYKGRADKGYHENGVLPAGEVTQCSLGQVYMRSVATNEDVEALDGNKNGTYDILVLSQAVQTEGFADAKTALNTAFGEANATNAAKWFGGEEFEILPFAANADELVAALEAGKDVMLIDDVKIDPASMSNAYGTTGINVKNGQTIDGGGHTLDIKGAGGTWDSGINTTGGTIKNITVTGSFRGIFINHNSDHSEPVVLENVTIDGTTYTISCDQGLYQNFEATGSTFNGWTSYAKTLGSAKFVDCSFGEGNGYAYCRSYAPTDFIGCDFEAGYTVDPRAAVTFENCTIGGVALTAANLDTLVVSEYLANATVK